MTLQMIDLADAQSELEAETERNETFKSRIAGAIPYVSILQDARTIIDSDQPWHARAGALGSLFLEAVPILNQLPSTSSARRTVPPVRNIPNAKPATGISKLANIEHLQSGSTKINSSTKLADELIDSTNFRISISPENALQHVSTGGVRNEFPLTAAQQAEARSIALEYGASEDMIRFSDTMNTAYGNMFGKEILYISNDVLPAANPPLGGMAANSRLSMRASIAHELYGHRAVNLAGGSRKIDGQIGMFDNAIEEAEASIRAARFAPGLSSTERNTLLMDAIARLRSQNIRISQVREQLRITQP